MDGYGDLHAFLRRGRGDHGRSASPRTLVVMAKHIAASAMMHVLTLLSIVAVSTDVEAYLVTAHGPLPSQGYFTALNP